jgi:lipopolysaccharide transport system permease protein
MAIYTFVFSFVFKLKDNRPVGHPSGIDSYPVYLLAGLLAWNFFNITIGTSMSSMIGNGSLVKKAAFPRSAIVLATVAAQLLTFLIELGLLTVVVLALRHMVLPYLPLAIVLIVLLAMFTSGLALILAGLNVYLRDLQHLWTLFAQMLFYATPIVYPVSLVHQALRGRRAWIRRVYDANPMGVFVRAFRNVFFDLRVPSLGTFGALAAFAIVSLTVGFAVFSKLERRLAEEL